MSVLKPVSRTTLSEQVALQIIGMISAGKWRPGDKLPSEAELCKALHVGRSTLREALKSLSFAGLVRMRAGEGTYVAQGYRSFLQGIFTHSVLEMEKTVFALYEARLVLEGELAAFCAERATDEDLQKLEELVTQMQAHAEISEERFLELELSFHSGIAAASKNHVLANVFENVREHVAEFVRKTHEMPNSRERAYANHAEILNALKDRNPEKARRLMREHVRRSKEAFELLFEASREQPRPQELTMARGQPD
jgi:GntR family transcriptional repressor for pyruvate dehydrogenase complex